MADGGKRCQLLCEKEGEPLIQGMVVGTEKDRLDVDQGNAVRGTLSITRERAHLTQVTGGPRDPRLSKAISPKMARCRA